MSAAHKAELHPDETIKMGKLAGTVSRAGAGIGVLFLVITVVWGLAIDDEMSRFFHSYLLALTYFMSIALGALFFVVLQHLTKSRWSVVVRRIAELLTATFPILFLLALGLAIPLLLGNDSLYLWSKPAEEIRAIAGAGTEHLVHGKHAWLNRPFFAIRIVGYFAIWIAMSRWFFKKSVEQDGSGDAALTGTMRKVSGPSMIVFALTLCYASFDLLMSLDPAWFSTIFGVYYFAGSCIAIFASLALIAMWLQARGKLTHSITVEHYHDLGKLLFAFVFFWSYIAFSQFMLIWYGNIPEETGWFYHRMFTSWKWLSLLLLFGHCVFPFICLLSRWTKRKLHYLLFFSSWMMLMHYFDLFWLVMPEYDKSGFSFSGTDVTAMIGVGGLFAAAFARAATKVNLIPTKDPNLSDSLSFENY